MTVEQSQDDQDLAALGYKQELVRTMGGFSTFATGFAFISILTGMFLLFGFAYGTGGPASIWAWIIALVGQLLFALTFAELAVRWPLAGSVYNWTKHLTGGSAVSWMAAIAMTLALIVGTAAVALAAQVILPQVSDVFWIYGDGSGPKDATINGAILGGIMLISSTAVSLMGARVRSLVNNVGVSLELIAVIAIIVGFLIHTKRSPAVVFQTNGTESNYSIGYLGALMLALVLGVFVMYGFDTAASVGEETINPRKTSPRAIIRAILASGVFGALLLLTAFMSVDDITSADISSGGLAYVIKDVLGNTFGDIALICSFFAVFVAQLANQTGAVNMMFAMSRDNALPGSARLARVAERAKTPVLPPILVAVIAFAVILYNIQQPSIIVVVSTTAAIFAIVAYFLITLTVVLKRLRGEWEPFGPGYFSLGRFGLPISVAATVWGGFMIVNLAWPREALYNPAEPFHWYLRWGGVLLPTIAFAFAFAVYWFIQRHKIGILPEHAATTATAADAPTP